MIRARGIAIALAALAAALAGPACTHPRPDPAARCPHAPVEVHGQDDLAALAGCARLAGLTIRSAAPLDLTPLADLTTIGGDLVIGPTLAVRTVRLPALVEVGGTLRVAASADLGGIYLPALTRAGAVELVDDVALIELSLPVVREVMGDLTLTRVPSLEIVDTRALDRVGGALTVVGARALAVWLHDGVTVAGAVALDAPALDPEAAAGLSSSGSSGSSGSAGSTESTESTGPGASPGSPGSQR